MFSISHHGAVSGVTGSCHQLTLENGHALLVDCGMFQGAEATPGDSADSIEQRTQIGFDLAPVKALVITHCHIDHVGRIPWLLAAGFDGPVLATKATCRLLPLVIEDALKVGVTRDPDLIAAVIHKLRSMLVPCDYGEWVAMPTMSSGKELEVCARFQVAGHILGSAYVEFEITCLGDAPQSRRVVFSGDLGAPHSPLLPDPKPPERADVVVLESTYGDRLHEDRVHRRERLQAVLERCLANKGTVLIPAFSIGRTQELLYELEDILHGLGEAGGRLSSPLNDRIDVVVDSPLAAKFTEYYRELAELWDAEAKERLSEGRHPLSFEQLLTIDNHQDHLNTVGYLRRTGKAAIVIAASGMCSGGRIVNYLKALLGDERTDVLFVGYQAKGTPGRDIQTWGPRGGWVDLDGRRIDIRANIETLGGYSAHADQADLVRFVTDMREPPGEIRLVHGDESAKRDLQRVLQVALKGCEVVIPSAFS